MLYFTFALSATVAVARLRSLDCSGSLPRAFLAREDLKFALRLPDQTAPNSEVTLLQLG